MFRAQFSVLLDTDDADGSRTAAGPLLLPSRTIERARPVSGPPSCRLRRNGTAIPLLKGRNGVWPARGTEPVRPAAPAHIGLDTFLIDRALASQMRPHKPPGVPRKPFLVTGGRFPERNPTLAMHAEVRPRSSAPTASRPYLLPPFRAHGPEETRSAKRVRGARPIARARRAYPFAKERKRCGGGTGTPRRLRERGTARRERQFSPGSCRRSAVPTHDGSPVWVSSALEGPSLPGSERSVRRSQRPRDLGRRGRGTPAGVTPRRDRSSSERRTNPHAREFARRPIRRGRE